MTKPSFLAKGKTAFAAAMVSFAVFISTPALATCGYTSMNMATTNFLCVPVPNHILLPPISPTIGPWVCSLSWWSTPILPIL